MCQIPMLIGTKENNNLFSILYSSKVTPRVCENLFSSSSFNMGKWNNIFHVLRSKELTVTANWKLKAQNTLSMTLFFLIDAILMYTALFLVFKLLCLQSTCLYYCYSNEASKCVFLIFRACQPDIFKLKPWWHARQNFKSFCISIKLPFLGVFFFLSSRYIIKTAQFSRPKNDRDHLSRCTLFSISSR